jgi:hypothetical protein
LPGLPPKLATELVEIIVAEMRKDAVRTITAPPEQTVGPNSDDESSPGDAERKHSAPEIAVLTTNRDAVFRAVTSVRQAIERGDAALRA